MSARAWHWRRLSKHLRLELKRAIGVVEEHPDATYRMPPPFDDLVVVSYDRYQRLKRAGMVESEIVEDKAGAVFRMTGSG